MRFDDVVEVITSSAAADWDKAEEFDPTSLPGQPAGARHHYLAAYRPQPHIRLGWGRRADDGAAYPYGYPWIGARACERAAADAFWHDELATTWMLWLVDNDRCYLPDAVPGMLSAKPGDIALARLIMKIAPLPGWGFAEYMRDAGIIPVTD